MTRRAVTSAGGGGGSSTTLSPYAQIGTAPFATTGLVRWPGGNQTLAAFRNNANSANINIIAVDTGDSISLGSTSCYAFTIDAGSGGFAARVGGSNAFVASTTLSAMYVAGTLAFSTSATKAIFAVGTRRKVTAVTDTYTILTTDELIAVGTLAAGKTLTLPAATTGDTYTIKDTVGEAATRNITIAPAAGTIDGAANYVISTNYASVTLVYTGSQWSIV